MGPFTQKCGSSISWLAHRDASVARDGACCGLRGSACYVCLSGLYPCTLQPRALSVRLPLCVLVFLLPGLRLAPLLLDQTIAALGGRAPATGCLWCPSAHADTLQERVPHESVRFPRLRVAGLGGGGRAQHPRAPVASSPPRLAVRAPSHWLSAAMAMSG
ncbi:hypothetical protein NDU88_006374 [Pleurodeles waltl]|uniref:Uncharacterized protein n=1 Tax=Pleurodeles waltl TaxID=8319 RepID=A0AAV7MDQ1_PLEWA|nr:hypothetical protein NDU88_006374 [Pleurodeles waltl]